MTSLLWSMAELDAALARNTVSPWVRTVYAELQEKVADPGFPCTFGTVAHRKGEILYSFAETSDDAAVVDAAVVALTAYTERLRPLSPVTAAMQPLAFCTLPPTPPLTIEQHFKRGWELVQAIHARDPQPWPPHVPRDPDDPRWSFCFNGMSLFINFKTPAHQQRRSRRCANAYLLLIQARDGFDIVAGDTPQGRRARQMIREKLLAYDALPISRALAHYGSAENREWQQYFVPETDSELHSRCPFHAKS